MKKAELVFIPAPGFGHVVSAVEMGNLLISRDDGLSITVLMIKLPVDTGVTTYAQSLRENASPRITFVDLPRDDHYTSTLMSTPMSPVLFFSSYIDSHTTRVREAVANITSSPLSGFVIDVLCTCMIDVANHFGLPTYGFFPSGAAFLGLNFYLLSLTDDHNQDVTQYKDSHAELPVPCFINMLPANVLPYMTVDTRGGAAMALLSITRKFREMKGIIINTFSELESHAIGSLGPYGISKMIPPVYPVGPLLHTVPTQDNDEIIRWLDDQPDSSVVFLCFGSMGSFEEEQVKEIAHALEISGYRFLWSLRRPPPQKGTMEVPTEYTNPTQVLPQGFLERTKEIGRVVGWVPQMAVLSHVAVGGFVTHCGWNSILESLWCGVPMAAWPLYAEQQLNAFHMVVELKLAVEIKMDYRREILMEDSSNLIMGHHIQRCIREVMKNDSEIRKNVKEMKDKCRMAVMKGGSSYNSLRRFIEVVKGVHEPE